MTLTTERIFMSLPKPKTAIAYPTSLEQIEELRLYHNKEISPEMVAIHAMNPGVLHNSPSRSVMLTQHLPAHLVISGSEPPNPMSGLEYEMGKYTFGTRMPENGKIVEVIKRYSVAAGSGGISGQPEITVIYQIEDSGELDVFHIKQWESFHQYFGYANKPTEALNTQLWPGRYIPKDTVFADTPAMAEDGGYTYGVNLETAAMDVPGVAEDGVILSEAAVKKFGIKIYETREVSCGQSCFPVNLNGDDKDYKIFQDIGEYIRHDGLLMVTRPYGERMSAATMGAKELRTVDHIFDKKVYTRETSVKGLQEKCSVKPGRIVDIQVIRNNDQVRHLPPTMTTQLDKYAKALKNYYQEILAVEARKIAENRKMGGDGRVRMSPKLQNLIVRAKAVTGQTGNRFQGNIGLQYRRSPLDEYTITFVVEHLIFPNKGFKITGTSGDKGVICDIWPEASMPINAEGVRAEIIVSSNSTIARSNWARGFNPYFAAAARDLTKELRAMVKLSNNPTEEQVELLEEPLFLKAYEKLLKFYAIVSPKQFWWYSQKVKDPGKRRTHLFACLQKPVRIFMPVDNAINDIDAVLHLERDFPQCYSPVTYRGENGIFVTTPKPVRIAPHYILLLEKIADSGSSTSIGQLQHHGLLASQTKSEKYSLPYRPSPTRNTGESEARLLLFYAKSPECIADILDRSNNPETMRAIASRILRDPTPTNIQNIVDRYVIKYGNTRPLQFFKHFMATQGMEISYMPETEAFSLGIKEPFDAR